MATAAAESSAKGNTTTSSSNPKITMTDWQQQMETVEMRYSYMMEHQIWTDCSFLVGPEEAKQEDLKEIFCHRLYLANSSPVFAAMFYGDLAQNQQFKIRITDATPAAFQAFLLSIYTNSVIKCDDYSILWELLILAKKYLLSDAMLEECRRHLSTFMHRKAQNVWLILENAENMDEIFLYQSALRLAKSQNARIANFIVTKNFLTVSQDFLLNLVQSEDLYWPEYILYLACYFWCKYQASLQLENTLREMSNALNDFIESSNLIENSSVDQELQVTVEVDPVTVKAYMKHFLPYIRFLIIDAQKLEIILEKYCFFKPGEKNYLYSSCLESKFAYLPKRFCCSRNSREHPVQSIYTFGHIESESGSLFCGELFHRCFTIGKFDTDLNKSMLMIFVIIYFPTQIKPLDIESNSYKELVTVILTNSDNKIHLCGPLSLPANYNSKVHTTIHPPSDFHAGKGELCVKILHHKSGYYPTCQPRIIVIKSSYGSMSKWECVNARQPFPQLEINV